MYKFGLMVVRSWTTEGSAPRTGTRSKARQVLGSGVSGAAARLLDRTLADDPKARPTMDDWYQTLRGRTVSVTRPAGQAVRYVGQEAD